MTIVSHGEDGTCASAENSPKKLGTVQSHLTTTIRALWQDEFSKELVERDVKISSIEEELKKKDAEIDLLTKSINKLTSQLQVRILKYLKTSI